MVAVDLIFHLLHKLALVAAVAVQVLPVQQQGQLQVVLAVQVQHLQSQAFLQPMLAVEEGVEEQLRLQDKLEEQVVLVAVGEEKVQTARPLQELFTQAAVAVLGQTELQVAKMAAPV